MSIEGDFERLRNLLLRQEDRAQSFNPPATTADFEALKVATGVTVRGGLRKLWSLANGAEEDATCFDVWVAQERRSFRCDFLSTSQSIWLWRMAHDFSGGGREPGRSDKVQDGWFRKHWIPFACYNTSSTIVYYDAEPAPTGSHGQIIVYDDDPAFVHWHSRTLGEFLKKSIRVLGKA